MASSRGLKILVSAVQSRPETLGNSGNSAGNDGSAPSEFPESSTYSARAGTPGAQPETSSRATAWLPISAGRRFTLIDAEDLERCMAFRWQGKAKKSAPGKFYVQRSVRVTPGRTGKKSSESLHRFLKGCVPGDGKLVDHRNGNSLDNRKDNLRVTDARGNSTNITSSKQQKLGGYKGVSWHPRGQKWQASICCGEPRKNGKRKQVYLGLFDDPIEAAKAYDREARAHFGEFASCNFPLSNEVARAS